MCIDLSEYKKLLQEKKDLSKKLEENQLQIQNMETITLLSGGIAHDFNNILTGIIGNLTLLRLDLEETFNYEHQSIIEIEKAIFRAAGITKKLSSLSKKEHLLKKVVNIEAIIKDTASFSIVGSNCLISYRVDPKLWNVKIDSDQISQVINNLLINASQAMEKTGNIDINITNLHIIDQSSTPLSCGKYVKIDIRDFGCGIKKGNWTKIFEPYFTTKKDGSGLGLASCYNIIKNHNGWITFSSEEGIGTTFTFYLPASFENIEQEKVDLYQEKKEKIYRVLIMDDEISVCSTIDTYLKSKNFIVTSVISGSEAIAVYESAKSKYPFDIVILDLSLKNGINGHETSLKLRQIDPKIKIIGISGYPFTKIDCTLCNGLHSKPFTYEHLLKTIYELLSDSA